MTLPSLLPFVSSWRIEFTGSLWGTVAPAIAILRAAVLEQQARKDTTCQQSKTHSYTGSPQARKISIRTQADNVGAVCHPSAERLAYVTHLKIKRRLPGPWYGKTGRKAIRPHSVVIKDLPLYSLSPACSMLDRI